MNELYAEAGVKRKDTTKTMLLRALMVFCVIVSIFLNFASPSLVIVSVVVILVVVFLYPRLSIEYEYVFCDGQLDIDKIMGKVKRKNILKVDFEQVQIIAPETSHELDGFKKPGAVMKDFSSLSANAKPYIIVTRLSGESVLIKFEPSEKMLTCMKQKAPRKVITY